MASDVIVKITQKAAPKTLGFGIPLLLSTMETAAVPYAEGADIDEVKAKFGEDTALYKAAKLLLMQEDAPAKIAVCGVTEKGVEGVVHVRFYTEPDGGESPSARSCSRPTSG